MAAWDAEWRRLRAWRVGAVAAVLGLGLALAGAIAAWGVLRPLSALLFRVSAHDPSAWIA